VSKAGEYRSALRSNVRGLWSGVIDRAQFVQLMFDTVGRYIPEAWYEGAAECGIKKDELTDKEISELAGAISYEIQWIQGLADAIEENRKNDGKLASLFSRMEIWAGRYLGVRDKAKAMACADAKLKWVQGPTSDKCPSCSKLNGKVKRGSFWTERGILPRVHGAPYLECQGFRCLCELQVTDDPVSRGPLPNLP